MTLCLLASCGEEPSPGSPEPGPDRQRQAPPSAKDEAAEALRELQQLGYVGGSERVEASGVTMHREGQVDGGRMNLYCSGHGPEAVLMDLDGTEWHRWRCTPDSVWPDLKGKIKDEYNSFRRVYLYPNGDLLAIFEGIGLVKLNRDSEVLWAHRNGAHHDLKVRPDGSIYLLTRTAHVVPWVHPTEPILEDFVSVLDAEGNERSRVSLLECVEAGGVRVAFRDGKVHKDPFHTNTLQIVERPITGLPQVQPGMVLVSFRNMSRLAFVDLDQRRMVHGMGGTFRGQHEPILLDSGHLLLFDNLGLKDRSRVLELDLRTGQILWSYEGSEKAPFFSELCGTARRFPDGQTLITESSRGRALQITRDGTIVWEFYNPHRFGEGGEYIAELFELVRLPEGFPVEWTRRAQEGG